MSSRCVRRPGPPGRLSQTVLEAYFFIPEPVAAVLPEGDFVGLTARPFAAPFIPFAEPPEPVTVFDIAPPPLPDGATVWPLPAPAPAGPFAAFPSAVGCAKAAAPEVTASISPAAINVPIFIVITVLVLVSGSFDPLHERRPQGVGGVNML